MRHLETLGEMRVPVGQRQAADFLRKAVLAGNTAFLLSGAEHIGKSSLSLYFACMLNCLEESAPCGQCSACRRILKGSFADVRREGIETNEKASGEEVLKTGISTEQVKDIIESASSAPYEGRAKVFIIENADYMSTAAANRLLKTLEEHEPNIYFMLLAENADMVLPTVSSRLTKVELKEAASQEISAYLISLGADAFKAQELSESADGKAGWAVCAFENPEMADEREDFIQKGLALSQMPLTERMGLAGELSKMFSKNRASVYRLLDVWCALFRDMLVASLGQSELMKNKRLQKDIEKAATEMGADRITLFLKSLIDTKKILKQNTASLLALEVMMLSV